MLLSLLFLFVLFSASANKIEWSWKTASPYTLFYRYQLNGEGEEGWTVVGKDETSVILPVKEKENTFFIQASNDGKVWSESAIETYSVESDTEKEKYELSFLLSPYTFQKVTYSEKRSPQSRTTCYGNLFGVSFTCGSNDIWGLTVGVSSSWHRYSDFHDYRDLKGDLKVRGKILESDNLQYRMYFLLGIGADSVWRDDGDWGIYPMVIWGVKEAFLLESNRSLDWGCDFAFSFQDGSTVLHLLPYIALTYHWERGN